MDDRIRVLRQPTIRVLRKSLLAWFDQHARDLPWRTPTRDPYAVWVSETMLQQTRVATVIPYFHRFMDRFPTLDSLASAPIDDVLAAWSGLGYYRRARSMHAAANRLVGEGKTSLPSDHAALLSYPGIGNYTAAAISSIAFGQVVPVVDGNVIRVLARLTDDDEPVGTTTATKRTRSVAEQLIDPDRPGAFNEAMMELGATVCVPGVPVCGECPWQQRCRGLRAGRVEDLPVVPEKGASPRVILDALVVTDGAQVLLCQRMVDGLFGGLWEPPMLEARGRGNDRVVLDGQVGALVGGAVTRNGERVRGRIVHVLTHRILDVRVHRWVVAKRSLSDEVALGSTYERVQWVSCDELPSRGMSSLAVKVLAKAGIDISR